MSPEPPEEATGRDEYLSVESGPEIECKVKGSRFLAQLFRAEEEEEARALLVAVRRRYHDATHHCSAWRIGPPEDVLERFDDDGEPSGTAGRPLLAALVGPKLFDALVVVTRYFGGTKLGAGGLARAYGEAASRAVDEAPRRRIYRCATLLVRCGYDDSGLVETLLSRRSAILRNVERDFGERALFRLDVLTSQAEALRRALVESTAGRVEIEEIDPP